nr:immunoglobulin light chain junction region [Macaca mulatta]MOX51595.1 immunoglobulin light chain junction region [Macaca mulatta]
YMQALEFPPFTF